WVRWRAVKAWSASPLKGCGHQWLQVDQASLAVWRLDAGRASRKNASPLSSLRCLFSVAPGHLAPQPGGLVREEKTRTACEPTRLVRDPISATITGFSKKLPIVRPQ